MYILQQSLSNYFREINSNNEVILVHNVCESMLFDSRNKAELFKYELKNNYDCEFVIIEF